MNNVNVIKVPLGPIQAVFNAQEEQEIVDYLQKMESMLFGYSITDLQKIAFDLAVKTRKSTLSRIVSLVEIGYSDFSSDTLNSH